MNIRPFVLLLCSLLCAVPAVAGGPDNKSTDPKNDTIVEEIVARVNNHIVTRSEYLRAEQEVKNEAQQASPAPSPQDVAEREKEVLRDLISQQLLLQKGQDMGINADTDLVKRLDEIRKQMKLESMDDLEKAAQAQGVSFEEFKENLRTNIITQQVIQREVGGNIKISHEDTAKYYEQHKNELARPEQVRLSEILVSTAAKPVAKTDTGSTGDTEAAAQATEQQRIAEAQAKANSLLDEIKKGAKFADVARKNSDGPTAAQGGDLGYFKRGTLAKELEDKTFAMKPGDVSDVIQTKQGFVILMATEHQKAGVPPLKDVEAKLQDALYYEKLQPALKQYVTKLREDAFIYVKPGYVDTGASPNETAPVFTTASVEKGAKPLKKKKKFLVF